MEQPKANFVFCLHCRDSLGLVDSGSSLTSTFRVGRKGATEFVRQSEIINDQPAGEGFNLDPKQLNELIDARLRALARRRDFTQETPPQ